MKPNALLSIVVPVFSEEKVDPRVLSADQGRRVRSRGPLRPRTRLCRRRQPGRNPGRSPRAAPRPIRRVKIISLSRNFGHQFALTAGLDYAAGDAVVVIDGDLQDPPEVIPEMIAKLGGRGARSSTASARSAKERIRSSS